MVITHVNKCKSGSPVLANITLPAGHVLMSNTTHSPSLKRSYVMAVWPRAAELISVISVTYQCVSVKTVPSNLSVNLH